MATVFGIFLRYFNIQLQMDVDRHRERTKLLPLNLHSQAHF